MNKKVTQKFKDELKGIPLKDGRCVLMVLKKKTKLKTSKCKGIKQRVVSKTITMENFENCLSEDYIEYLEYKKL